MSGGFDRRRHRLADNRWFEDLTIGERFAIPSRTVTEAHFAAFQTVSADNHPIHYDVEYCRERGYPAPLAHGFQILCFTAAGAGTFAHAIGDALYPMLEIAALTPQRTTGIVSIAVTVHNQRGELVLTGEQKYLLRKRDPGLNPAQ